MTLKEITVATIAQTKFVPNRPFEISLGFEWGKIEYFSIIQLHEGKGTHHSIKSVNGKWEDWGQPLAFGELQIQNWSHGCKVMSGWVISENLEIFHDDVFNVVSDIASDYSTMLRREKNKYIEAEELMEKFKL